ncbi:MAG: acyltransferase [Lachnospiraceae bacterium]|nr:acyltransferase [Lachnospiraceae bacterium]
MKEKKLYLDILRIIAISMVFNLHFTVALGQQYGVFFGFANGNWGNVGTSLFFLISGNCLARNYGEKLEIGKFYKKRWLAIFPMFYVSYLLVLFGHMVILQNNVLAGVEPWKFIYTLIGIDMYMVFKGVRTAALVGEWYTAIIVGIYLLFPLLQFLYRKCKIPTTIILLALYVVNLIFGKGEIPADAHIITGVFIFWIGMFIYRFEKQLEKMPWFVWVVLVALSCVLLFVPLPGYDLIYKNLLAILIFLVLMRVGIYLKKDVKVLRFLCKIEYAIYLCHHTVLLVLLTFYVKVFGQVEPISYYVSSVAVTIVFAIVITYLTNWIVKGISKIGSGKTKKKTKIKKKVKNS